MTHHTTKPVATIYRMVMADHTCPYGIRANHLLRAKGYQVEDRWLTSREEVDAFKAESGVATTPQIIIDGQRIGGHDDLRRYFGLKVPDADAVTYQPVAAVFLTAAGLALAASFASTGAFHPARAIEWFVAFAMMILAMLKLQDIDRFATMFLGYDLLARRWPPYAWIYPVLEWGAGLLMAAHLLDWLSIPVAAFIGLVGSVSVIYAVYIQKRDLKCACVGGSSRVPLGFVSLSENVIMVLMALWMLGQHI
jgi:glutaredoxin